MKNIVRQKYIEIRKNIINKKEKSLIIKDRVLSLLTDYHVIGVYASMDDEVSSDELIEELLKQSKVVVVPVIQKDSISFYQIKSLSELNNRDNKYQIREPYIENAVFIDKKDIEAMIIPGIVFDTSLSRIGFGKGCFDKYLADTTFYKIGVCFDEQISEKEIPHHRYDVKMDMIISDQRMIKYDSK